MTTRSQSTTPEQQDVVPFVPNESTTVNSIIDLTNANLHYIEQFILKSKEALGQRQQFQNAIQNIQDLEVTKLSRGTRGPKSKFTTCRNTWRLKKSRMKFTNKTICQAQFRIISLKMRSKPGKPKTAQTRRLSNSTPGHFMKTGKIYIHWKSLNIKDYIRVTRCYNCQKYGHVSKFCKSEKQRGFCASTTHETKKLHGQRQLREAQMCELCPEQTK